MFKRVRWMSVGAVVGLGSSVWAQRRVRRAMERYLPERLGSEAAGRARDIREAIGEGREAMRAREAELRAQMAARALPSAGGTAPPPRTGRPGRVIDIAEGSTRHLGPAPAPPGAPAGRRRTRRARPRRQEPGD